MIPDWFWCALGGIIGLCLFTGALALAQYLEKVLV